MLVVCATPTTLWSLHKQDSCCRLVRRTLRNAPKRRKKEQGRLQQRKQRTREQKGTMPTAIQFFSNALKIVTSEPKGLHLRGCCRLQRKKLMLPEKTERSSG